MSAKEQKKTEKKKKSIAGKIAKILITLFIVIIVLAALLIMFIDTIIKTAVTSIGPDLTGTPVRLEEFDTKIFGGSVYINGLAVGNPAGYQKPDALGFNSLFIKIDPASLMTDNIIVEEVIVDGLHVDYEIQTKLSFESLFSGDFSNFSKAESNLTRILDNVQAYADRMSGGAQPQPDSAAEPEKTETAESGKQVTIKNILVQNTVISFSSAAFNTTLTIPMPDFEMNEQKETSYAEAINNFFIALYENVAVAVAEYLKENSTKLAGVIGEGLSAVADEAEKHLESLGETIGEQIDGLSGKVNDLTDSLKLDKLF